MVPATRRLQRRSEEPPVRSAGFTLLKEGNTVGYYRSLAVSYGFQAGMQSFGYALYLMNDAALGYLDRRGFWEVGVGPTPIVLDQGASASFTPTTAKDDIYDCFSTRRA
jgi:lipid-binding SYLF domain-containing protein